jgi:putative flippase GtrA
MHKPSASVATGATFSQIIRYGVVGVTSNLAMYFLYLLLTQVRVEPKTAMTCVYAIGVLLGFAGNRQWTFKHRGAPAATALRYALAHCVGYALNFSILLTFVDGLGYAHQWVQVVAIFVVALFLFIAFKFFVFRK